MLFNSLAFAIFLPVVFLLYWAIPHRARWSVLVLSGYYFYMTWNAKYVVLIFFTTLVSYLAAIFLEKAEEKSKKTILLIAALTVILGVLFFFKYFNFFNGEIVQLLQSFAIPLSPVTMKLVLPVGISFYSFQMAGYLADVYRGECSAERHFGKYAAFVCFFPQMTSGPIARTKILMPQINTERFFDPDKVVYGLKQMAWGFFKKLVIADSLGAIVDMVYGDLLYYRGFVLLIAAILYTVQIYCDFSGYSDIAIGIAHLFSIDLMINFKSPYFSASVREFWSRWHISLSTWFRDYLYIPLGGNRKGKLRGAVNVMITFLASGLWHGASWNFVVWGGIHGMMQVLENLLFKGKKTKRTGISWIISVILVFFFATFAWIFFRAGTLGDATSIIVHMWDGIGSPLTYLATGVMDLKIGWWDGICLMLPLALLIVYDYLALTLDPLMEIKKLPKGVRYLIYYAFLFLFFMLSSFNAREFVYFQF